MIFLRNNLTVSLIFNHRKALIHAKNITELRRLTEFLWWWRTWFLFTSLSMGGKMIKKGRKFTSFDYNIVLILSGSISASSCIISAALSSNFFSIKPKRTTHCPTSGVGWVRLRRLECERWKRVQLKGPYQMEAAHGGRWDWKKCN